MKSLRSHFVFNKSERNGIFLLVLIIIVLQGIYFLVDPTSEVTIPPEKEEEVARFQARIDSLKRLVIADTMKIYPFNPNFISDFKGYTLGMSVEEIDRLHAFRALDNWINSEKEFQEVTMVSDSLLKRLKPYFKFPKFVDSRKKVPDKSVKQKKLRVQDLNDATAETLMLVNGVGEVLSNRIVKYRESIGGFRDEQQLKDVYGLSPEVVDRITQSFKILSVPEIEKQDLNQISVVKLSEIPGITYELARDIIEYREQKKRIETFAELGNIKGFPIEKLPRIQLYLTIK